ncbi:MAG: FG-GAP-like repeat-containing protein [Pyrinomonadaceae bacterium]
MNKQKSAAYYRHSGLFILIFIGLLAALCSVLWLRSAPVKAQNKAQNDELVPSIVVFSENFDSVTAPALPAGWTTSHTGAINSFTTVTTSPDSAPNAAYVNDPNTEGVSDLISPSIALGNIQHKLIFRHLYQTDYLFDGGVLEISINGGTFVDIISAGGTFVSNGYDIALDGSPLVNRPAWTGQQVFYKTTEVNLPANTANQSVRFRWRIACDPMEAGNGWWIDNIQVTNAISGVNSTAISIPGVGAAAPYPSDINVSGLDGLITGVQVSLTNFTHNSPDDVDLMLVAPNGYKVVLMSDVGGSNPVSNVNLFITDAASASFPDSSVITSGNYKPTNFEPNDVFPAPAPAGAPSSAMLSVLNGTTPNGTWQLYLADDNGNNAGSISGGWNISVQSSTDAIGFPEVGAAQPYSSNKTVFGLLGTVTKATVTLSNFSHSSPDDVDIMLVAPNGRRVVLMSDVGGTTEVGSLNLTFDDTAVSNLPDNSVLTSGTYKPTDFEIGDIFPAPAPQGATTGTTLNAFYGSAPNGTWKLFAVDDNGANAGSIAGSWSIALQTSTTACAFTLTPSVQAFPTTGGSGSFAVNMPTGCSWSASTTSGFLTINSSLTGDGAGSLSFSVAPNMGGGRSGSIDISNGVSTRTFQVQQPSGCPFSLNQASVSFGSGGGSGNVGVTAGNVCSWQAATTASWIQITSSQQTGDGTVSFNVQPNTTANARSATVTLGAQSFIVNQSEGGTRRFDFDGDGKSDLSIFRPSVGEWWYLKSSNGGNAAFQFGNSADKIAPADYTGDGKADVAIWRPSTGEWFILRSEDFSYYSYPYGINGDIPAVGDFDGDEKADTAVFRPSDTNWYIRRSSDGGTTIQQFGVNGDVPTVADYDGDGKSDVAIYRPSVGQWWISRSTGGVVAFTFGNSTDKPVQEDYTGDGKADVAIFRPSTGEWFILRSENQSYYSVPFGTNGDIPVAGDYDGDGIADISVFRPSGSTWYLQRTTAGTLIQNFGISGDQPVPSAYIP